jgi:hypothetical protein
MSERITDDETRDDDFVRRVAGAYEPPALTPSRRAAIDERVRARIERRRYVRMAAPFATAAAATAALLLLLRAPAHDPQAPLVPGARDSGAGADVIAGAENAAGVESTRTSDLAAVGQEPTAAASEWEYALLFDTPADASETDRSAELPEEYVAITDVFLASAAGSGEG